MRCLPTAAQTLSLFPSVLSFLPLCVLNSLCVFVFPVFTFKLHVAGNLVHSVLTVPHQRADCLKQPPLGKAAQTWQSREALEQRGRWLARWGGPETPPAARQRGGQLHSQLQQDLPAVVLVTRQMQKADRTNSPQPSRSSETCCVRITHSQVRSVEPAIKERSHLVPDVPSGRWRYLEHVLETFPSKVRHFKEQSFGGGTGNAQFVWKSAFM